MATDGIDVPMTFGAVTGRILTGSRPQSLADLKLLRAASVSHIVNVCETADPAGAETVGIGQWLWNPTPDDGKPKSADWFCGSIRYAMHFLSAPGWCLYVHCYDGVNRGPSTVYAILRAWGIEPVRAKEMIIAARPIDIVGIRYAEDAEKALLQGW